MQGFTAPVLIFFMRCLIYMILFISYQPVKAQELYVFTEPASNMAAKSLGVRLLYKQFKMNHDGRYDTYRLEPEIMFGLTKNLMVHVNGYASNMFQSKLRLEGASLYAKYRFFSSDDIHSHFRMAAFGKIAVIDNPTTLTHLANHKIPDGNGGYIDHEIQESKPNYEIDMDGSNSGLSGGLIATKLVNKLAVSASAAYLYRLNNLKNKREVIVPWHAVNYSMSFGYLLFPKEYTSYKQTNFNLYAEFLAGNYFGTPIGGKSTYFVDIAPAVQFIINSIARVDLGYRTQLSGNATRMSNSGFLVRVEYNFLNVFAKK